MWDISLSSALIGAHLQKNEKGFRQRDVKFLMELFWNWQSSFLNRKQLENIHNNQIKRNLHGLVGDSWANLLGKKGPPTYKLTRSGIIGLLKKIREEGLTDRFESFLFARYFFRTYKNRFANMVEKTGAPMPLSFRQEIEDLLDVKNLEREKKGNVEKEI